MDTEEQKHMALGYFVHGALQGFLLDGASAEDVINHMLWGAEFLGVDILEAVE